MNAPLPPFELCRRPSSRRWLTAVRRRMCRLVVIARRSEERLLSSVDRHLGDDRLAVPAAEARSLIRESTGALSKALYELLSRTLVQLGDQNKEGS